jgi:hypothetical protein
MNLNRLLTIDTLAKNGLAPDSQRQANEPNGETKQHFCGDFIALTMFSRLWFNLPVPRARNGLGGPAGILVAHLSRNPTLAYGNFQISALF